MCVCEGGCGEGQFLFIPQHPEQELIKVCPGGLVVRTLGFHCHGLGSKPQGTEIL